MKSVIQTSLIVMGLSLTACGGNNAAVPTEELVQMREQSKLNLARGPQPLPEKIVYITKDKEVIKEQATLTDSYFKIDISDKVLSFYEGQSSSYKISLRVQDPDLQMKLTAKGLPAGAELKDVSTKDNPNAYELRWTPPLYTISYDEQPPKIMSATLLPVLISAKNPQKAEIVKGLALERSVVFSVFRNQERPSELVLGDLPSEIQEGQAVSFSVTAKFPGVDNNSPVKPYLGQFKDNTTQVAGSDYLEMDGSRYVSIDPSRPSVEYIGDYKWKFNLVFDTKNTPVETQKTKSGSAANVNFTQVRLGMRAFGAFNASPATVIRVKILRSTPAAETTQPAETKTEVK